MKKQNLYTVIFIIGVFLFITSCRFLDGGSIGGGSDYVSEADKFSIAFPGGASGVETKTDDVSFATSARSFSKSFDNRSDNYRSYEVQVLEIPATSAEGKSEREILVIGLNGWDKEPGTEIKDITVDGQKGIDSLRTVEIGPVSMTFREVVFWSDINKKLYVVKVTTTKKENTTTPEADAFVNSFKLKA